MVGGDAGDHWGGCRSGTHGRDLAQSDDMLRRVGNDERRHSGTAVPPKQVLVDPSKPRVCFKLSHNHDGKTRADFVSSLALDKVVAFCGQACRGVNCARG